MSRQTKREAIVTALTAISPGYEAVFEGAARSFDGRSPVAVVLSTGTQVDYQDRGRAVRYEHGFSVTNYIRCESGQEAAAEDALDVMAQAAIDALRPLAYGVPGTSAEPDSAPLRIVDGAIYRVERITITIEEFSSGI